MPKLGMYEDDVTLVEWLADDGAHVKVGDPLFVMETEKVADRDRADDAGILWRSRSPDQAPIGSRIGYLVSTEPRTRSCAPPRRPTDDDDDDRTLRRRLQAMMRIRLFEDHVRREFAKGDMPGFVHTYLGAEAVAAGVCAHLTDADMITSTHRGHGHCIAKGCRSRRWSPSCTGGRRGCARATVARCTSPTSAAGMLGANAIVGGGISLAVGGALAAQTLGDGRVAVSFFGDGAANEGIFHESLNLAAIWRLPVVFVCENNGWAESTPSVLLDLGRATSPIELTPTASRA